MKPKVSVIVPNYNHALFLKQRLDSIFNQTFKDFEVILLDDASTDESATILNAYKDHEKVSHVVINKNNSGSPFKQWQKGIALAKGDYIWIAESDDYCELTLLDQLLGLFKNNTVLAYCASEIINEKEEKKGRHKWADALDNKKWGKDYYNKGVKEIKKYLRYRNTITNASAVLVKASAIKNIDMPVHMMFCGDWSVWIQVLKQGDIAYTSNLLNVFRRHSASTKTIKVLEKEKQRIKEYLEIFYENSNFMSRLFNRNKYNWVINEWKGKAASFPKVTLEELGLPIKLIK